MILLPEDGPRSRAGEGRSRIRVFCPCAVSDESLGSTCASFSPMRPGRNRRRGESRWNHHLPAHRHRSGFSTCTDARRSHSAVAGPSPVRQPRSSSGRCRGASSSLPLTLLACVGVDDVERFVSPGSTVEHAPRGGPRPCSCTPRGCRAAAPPSRHIADMGRRSTARPKSSPRSPAGIVWASPATSTITSAAALRSLATGGHDRGGTPTAPVVRGPGTRHNCRRAGRPLGLNVRSRPVTWPPASPRRVSALQVPNRKGRTFRRAACVLACTTTCPSLRSGGRWACPALAEDGGCASWPIRSCTGFLPPQQLDRRCQALFAGANRWASTDTVRNNRDVPVLAFATPRGNRFRP